jgi:uncharacterized membrane protein YhaH (DUF805 family)
MEWYLAVLKKYAVFDGRARRKEYWMFFLFNIIAAAVLGVIDAVIGIKLGPLGLLGTIFNVALLIPGIAVSIRRLHDTGRSGWWNLIAFVPCIGALVLIYFLVQPGTVGDNAFGPDPKASSDQPPAAA